MGVLSRFGAAALLCTLGLAKPAPAPAETKPINEAASKALKEASLKLCHSTDEYKKTLQFLRDTPDLTIREDVARRIADRVSKGCDGASERFSVVILLLKKIGISETKAIDMSVEVSALPPEMQKNFVEVFTNSFLGEFFDFDYSRAMLLAFELSRDYRGDPTVVREDFIKLVRFCKEANALELPIKMCADYMTKIAKSSQYFQSGVAKPFLELFSALRERKDLSLDIKTSLRVAEQVLRNGPLGPENFLHGYELARKTLEFDKHHALDFAINLAGRSFVGDSPPIMQFPNGEATKL